MATARLEVSWQELNPSKPTKLEPKRHSCKKPDPYAPGRPYMTQCLECDQLWVWWVSHWDNLRLVGYKKVRWYRFGLKKKWARAVEG